MEYCLYTATGDIQCTNQRQHLVNAHQVESFTSSSQHLKQSGIHYCDAQPVMRPGTSLKSSDGNFMLTYKSNGSLEITDVLKNTIIWKLDIFNTKPACLKMQSDGNLVAYDKMNTPYWASKTVGKSQSKPFRLTMQKDGNLVIYDGLNKPLWASNTNINNVKNCTAASC